MSPYKFKPSVGVNLGVLQFGVELDEEADDYVRISDYYLLLNEIRDLRSVVGNIENQLGIFHDQYLDFIKLYKKDAYNFRRLLGNSNRVASRFDWSTSIISLPEEVYTPFLLRRAYISAYPASDIFKSIPSKHQSLFSGKLLPLILTSSSSAIQLYQTLTEL